MSYTRQDHDSADANWEGAAAYVRLISEGANASFEQGGTARGAMPVPIGLSGGTGQPVGAARGAMGAPLGPSAGQASQPFSAATGHMPIPLGPVAGSGTAVNRATGHFGVPLGPMAGTGQPLSVPLLQARLGARAALLTSTPLDRRLTGPAGLLATTPISARLAGTWTAPLAVRLAAPSRACVPTGARFAAVAGRAAPTGQRLTARAGRAPAVAVRLSAGAGRAVPVAARLALPTGPAAAPMARITAVAGRAVPAVGRLSAVAGAAPRVAARLALPTGPTGTVAARLALPSAAAAPLDKRLAGTARLSAARQTRLVAHAALIARDATAVRLTARAALQSTAVQLIAAPNHLLHNGRICPLLDAGISTDSGSPVWLAEVVLAAADDYRQIRIGDALTLMFWGQPVALVCDSRQLGRAPDGDSYRLTAISPVGTRGAPWASETTLGAAGMARAAVDTMLGAAVDWRLPDWPLPASAAHLTGAPLAIAQQIAGAAGGVLLSLPDGSVRVQPRDPTGVPDRAAAPAVALGAGDLLSQSERLGTAAIVNRLVIGSGAAASGGTRIQLESEVDPADGHAYTVRAFPFPWRAVELVHTGDAATAIGGRTEVTPEPSEQVEIQAGQGSVRYPVSELLDTSYRHVALGAVTADGTDLTTADPQYSLLDVRYRTRCWQWRVTNARDETIQFLAVE